MVDPTYLAYFNEQMHKDLKGIIGGPPTIRPGGVSMDHYQGLSASVASRVIPFAGQTYEASEYLYGWVPLRDRPVQFLYFQCAVLNVKGRFIPGNMQAATWVRAPIPGTIITPSAGFSRRYLPMSAFEQGDARPNDVFKNKVDWNPVLEGLNGDKAASKASAPSNYSTEMVQMGLGAKTYKVQVDASNALGLTQLAPYRGFTIVTQQRPPASNAGIDKPRYAFDEIAEKFSAIAAVVARSAQAGEDIGAQMISEQNAASMDLLYQQLDQMAGPVQAPAPPPSAAPPPAAAAPQAPAPAAPASGAPTPAQERVPCPTCSTPIGIGWKFCPKCRQELVWG
jgi:hypothetical protein